jgi:hypothetical protein
MSAASIAEAANVINPQEIQVERRLGQAEDDEIIVRGGAVLTPVAGNEWDSGLPRDIEELKNMLEQAKNAGNTALAKRIIKQLKVAGARNASKLRGLGKFRFGPPLLVPDWLLTDPCAFSPAIPVCAARGVPGV